jgi:oxygen-independent coproporphyrinogen-3 oxidase
LLSRLAALTRHNEAVIVADLIFGLPGQDEAVWRQDIADVMASGVHGVDLYQLISMAGTNLARADEKGTLGWAADGQQRAVMYADGARTLERGLERLSCSHWRRIDAEQSRYNQMAKWGAEILPFGAGAGATFTATASCMAGIWRPGMRRRRGVRAPGMVMRPNPDARLDGLLRGGLDTGWLALSQLPQGLVSHLMPLFEAWQRHGLARLSAERLALTLAGRFWNVNLQAGLFEYLRCNPPGGIRGRETIRPPGQDGRSCPGITGYRSTERRRGPGAGPRFLSAVVDLVHPYPQRSSARVVIRVWPALTWDARRITSPEGCARWRNRAPGWPAG